MWINTIIINKDSFIVTWLREMGVFFISIHHKIFLFGNKEHNVEFFIYKFLINGK